MNKLLKLKEVSLLIVAILVLTGAAMASRVVILNQPAMMADTVLVASSDASWTGGIDITNPQKKLNLPEENVDEAAPAPAILEPMWKRTSVMLSNPVGEDAPANPAPMSVMLSNPANGGYVSENFEIKGTTAPGAMVHVTVIGHQTSSWQESSSPSNSVLLDAKVTADSSGNFTASVDTGYLPSDSQITITTEAQDALGHSATNVTNVTLKF